MAKLIIGVHAFMGSLRSDETNIEVAINGMNVNTIQ